MSPASCTSRRSWAIAALDTESRIAITASENLVFITEPLKPSTPYAPASAVSAASRQVRRGIDQDEGKEGATASPAKCATFQRWLGRVVARRGQSKGKR